MVDSVLIGGTLGLPRAGRYGALAGADADGAITGAGALAGYLAR